MTLSTITYCISNVLALKPHEAVRGKRFGYVDVVRLLLEAKAAVDKDADVWARDLVSGVSGFRVLWCSEFRIQTGSQRYEVCGACIWGQYRLIS